MFAVDDVEDTVRLGRAAENAVWRNFHLTGAQELVHGVEP